jgi:hypothetical protein
MQVSATLIAAQQAAREARARLNVPQQAAQTPQQAAKPSFAAALGQAAPAEAGFAPLPLKQTAAPAQAAPAQPHVQNGVRLGQHVNIVI